MFKHGRSFNTQVYVPLYLFISRVQTRISAIHLKLLISGGLRGKRRESWTDTQSLRVTEGLWDPCCATTTPIQIHQLSTTGKYDSRTQSSHPAGTPSDDPLGGRNATQMKCYANHHETSLHSDTNSQIIFVLTVE